MTITQILRTDKNFRNRLKEILPFPKNIKLEYNIKDLITPCHKSYSVAGTAIHYMVYKSLYQKYKNKYNIDLKKVIEPAVYGFSYIKNNINNIQEQSILEVFKNYLNNNKIDGSKVIKDYLILANLESIYRSGLWNNSLLSSNSDLLEKDLLNLNSYISSLELNITNRLELGFDFKILSKSITNGDGDLIIDNSIIDIKSSKDPKIDSSIWYQLILYYLFVVINKDTSIEYIGFYFVRINKLIKFKTSDYYSKKQEEEAIEFIMNY